MLRSIWAWTAIAVLIVVWLPFLAVVRLFDRDPALYRTGYLFRRLGWAMTRVNPSWQVTISGEYPEDPRLPYVVVSNHQSLADVPVVSCLPWEMKWVGKTELFSIPLTGWMMRMAGDIKLDRSEARSGAKALLQARNYLRNRCSVIFFAEGTRSRDGRVLPFNPGAFHLAVREQVPILPIVIEGTGGALPKHDWRFGDATDIRLHILPAVETKGLARKDADRLSREIRDQIIQQIAAFRGVPPSDVDGEVPQPLPATANGSQ